MNFGRQTAARAAASRLIQHGPKLDPCWRQTQHHQGAHCIRLHWAWKNKYSLSLSPIHGRYLSPKGRSHSHTLSLVGGTKILRRWSPIKSAPATEGRAQPC